MTASVSVRRQKIRKNHTKKRLFFFLLLTALLMFVVIFAEQICPYDPNAQVFTTLEPPSAAHPAGTDRMGRDLLSRILVGLQTSVISTLTLVVIITAAGTAVGVVCGHLGGVVDSLMMRVSDVCLAFPGLVFALAIARHCSTAGFKMRSSRWLSSAGRNTPGSPAARRWRWKVPTT